MQPGGDGNTLHGGGYDRYRKGGFLEGYQFHSGRMFAGMVVVEFMLADEGPGDGGVAVVQGSHKSNYAAPLSLKTMERWQQHVNEAEAPRPFLLLLLFASGRGTAIVARWRVGKAFEERDGASAA